MREILSCGSPALANITLTCHFDMEGTDKAFLPDL